jgi:hypothetical protein
MLSKEEIIGAACLKAIEKNPPPRSETREEIVEKGLKLSAKLPPRPGGPTPEQIYLANRKLWALLEAKSQKRQLRVRFASKNQAATKSKRRVARARNRQAENARSTVVRFAERFGLSRYRVEQIRRAERDCSDADLFSLAIGHRTAREVLRYPRSDS